MGTTEDGQPCDPFDVPFGRICIRNPLPTPWSADVDPRNPLPEYPRPQMRRERWLNLNGIWEFEPYGCVPYKYVFAIPGLQYMWCGNREMQMPSVKNVISLQ
jgi:hypothetical protein